MVAGLQVWPRLHIVLVRIWSCETCLHSLHLLRPRSAPSLDFGVVMNLDFPGTFNTYAAALKKRSTPPRVDIDFGDGLEDLKGDFEFLLFMYSNGDQAGRRHSDILNAPRCRLITLAANRRQLVGSWPANAASIRHMHEGMEDLHYRPPYSGLEWVRAFAPHSCLMLGMSMATCSCP